ncbi:MAG: UDP-2,3-diacylglucosamine diphosphatase [Lysobacterales bacterium]
MATLFLSDLHLDASRGDIAAALTGLLRGPARQAKALYLLGDLFESWIGDDDPEPLAAAVAAELAALSASGVPVYFQHGNRDFLLGRDYADRAGMRLLGEHHLIDLYGVPTVLLHGDTLCSDDHAYQRLRREWRAPAWQAAFLAQTLDQRRDFAARARAESRAHTAVAASDIMDVNAVAVGDCFRRHHVTRIIHGHTHRPAIHPLQRVDGRDCQRIVLGDWHRAGSVLRVSENSLELFELPFSAARDNQE